MKIQPLILLCLMFATLSAQAEEKKTINIQFTVQEKAYRNYLGSQLDTCEKTCTSKLIKYLNNTFGFFRFEAGTEEPLLKIELTDREESLNTNNLQKETGFKVHLKQTGNLNAGSLVYWIFRSADRWIEQLPELKNEFANEIARELVNGLNGTEIRNQFVENVLSKVEVTDNFYFIPQEKWIILPLTAKENNIARQSLFLVVTSIHKLGFEDMDFYYKTQVVNAIRNIADLQEYHLPNIYQNGSLALQKLPDGPAETPFDSAHVNATRKKVFILKHVPLDGENNAPVNFISTSNPN